MVQISLFRLYIQTYRKTRMIDNSQQAQQYFSTKVQPIFTSLMTKIIKQRPEDIPQYVLKYFQHYNRPSIANSDSEQDEDRFEQISQLQFKVKKEIKLQTTVRKKNRKGVSSEANQMFTGQRKPFSMRPVGLKDQKVQIMIRFYFMDSFLFKDFSAQEKQFLINNMLPYKSDAGQTIITEGQYGNCMYFVESGSFECSIEENSGFNKTTRVLRQYKTGDVFGQLCLLHAAKRQATVISKTQGMLYTLTRDCFTNMRKMSIVKRRSCYMQNLKKVNIFANLSSQQFQKLCDLLTQVRFQTDEYVIHEGDMGTKFYIVLQGLLVAKNSQEDTFYQYYKEGDYFGQLALITKKPRQVSVQAVSKCRLVCLSSRVFLNVVNNDKAQNQIHMKYRPAKQTLPKRRKRLNTNLKD